VVGDEWEHSMGSKHGLESTVFGSVSSGSCLTNETMTNAGGGQAALLAMNSTALMQIGAVTGGTPTGSNWTGGTSGCVFTATATPTAYAGRTHCIKGSCKPWPEGLLFQRPLPMQQTGSLTIPCFSILTMSPAFRPVRASISRLPHPPVCLPALPPRGMGPF